MFSLNLGLAEQTKLRFRIERDKGLNVVGARDQLLSFREACISNLSLLLRLEPFEKFVVVGGGLNQVSC